MFFQNAPGKCLKLETVSEALAHAGHQCVDPRGPAGEEAAEVWPVAQLWQGCAFADLPAHLPSGQC